MLATESTATTAVQRWFVQLSDALERRAIREAADLFVDDCYWRDLIAFSWNITTVEGRVGVVDLLEHTLATTSPSDWTVVGDANPGDGGVVDAWFAFETAVGRGKGLIRLRGDRCWTLLTTLYELKGFEEPSRERRSRGVEHGVVPGRKTWADRRRERAADLGYATQPEVLIVGGGQGGIALAARLARLDVPTLVIDMHERPGDQWRKRYKSLALHDPVWYDHLPYLPFPENWPVFAPKDKIADWLEAYVSIMEIDYWSSTECTRAAYDDATQTWTVDVVRDGMPVTLKPKQLVLATGMSGIANVPEIPGAASFAGKQHHSSKHPGGDAYRGKRAVVIGSNNSAHDICADLYENGADVTMIQRTSTHIVKSDSLMKYGLGALYSEEAIANGMTTEKADLTFASIPYRIMHEFQIPVYTEIAKADAPFYERLERAGFKLDWGDDGSGLFMKYLRRGSGYYIDVGASELVAGGEIKLESGGVARIESDAVVLENGKRLPADLIVYATGYGSMNGWAAKLISQEVADAVGKCWGLGSGTTKDPGPFEGELRNMWKPTRQPGLWFHGGNLHQSRHYSLYLALQLKARYEGIPTTVYGLAEVHHRS